jgi:PAS domain S-box-containing protein
VKLPKALRREISDGIIRLTAPVIFFGMVLNILGIVFVGGHQYQRLLGAIVALSLIIPAWVFARKGKPMTGVLFLHACFVFAVLTGMTVSGGVHALAYTATLIIITVFTTLYGTWGGIGFGLSTLAAGGVYSLLISLDILHRVPEPTTSFLFVYHGILLTMQFFFVLIPVRLMFKALSDSQRQGAALEQAMTERKQAQDELQSILDKTPDIIYRLDAKGTITFVNEAIRKYGALPEDLIDRPVIELVHPDDQSIAHHRIAEKRTGQRSTTETEIRLRFPASHVATTALPATDRPWVLFQVTSTGLYRDNTPSEESFIGIQGIARDISRIRHFEHQLDQLAAVVEQAAEDVIITDPEGVIQYVNPRFEAFTGYSMSELVGKTPRIFKSGKHGDDFYAELWKTILRGEIWTGHIWNRIRSGKLVLQDVTISPIFDAAKKLTGYASVRRDITDQHLIQEQLQQAQKIKAIGTLAGGIAHDFNNILSGIIGYTELALAELKDRPSIREMLEHVMKAAERATDLVRQILSFSRSQKSEVKPVRPYTIAREVLKLLRASLPSTIEIKASIGSESYIEADATNIHQVLMNLCTNAAHAMREKGGVLSVIVEDVTLSRDDLFHRPDVLPGEFIKISVEDTGTGMTDDVQQKAFDPFFTTKALGEGTGMGLSTVHGIITDLSGFVTLYSDPGQGTSIHLFIPRILKPTKAEKPQVTGPIRGGTERILLVDDEPEQINLGQKALTRHGYQVTGFADSTIALVHFQQNPDAYDLVITDMTMPKMTGDILTQKILLKRSNIPVIMCTGYSEVMDEHKAQAIGIRAFLYKPLIMADLLKTIRMVLDQRKDGS